VDVDPKHSLLELHRIINTKYKKLKRIEEAVESFKTDKEIMAIIKALKPVHATLLKRNKGPEKEVFKQLIKYTEENE